MEKPHFMADFSDSPARKKSNEPKTACPMRMVSTSPRMGSAYSTMMCGSTNIPTDTKKMAPKRFFTGSTSLMILSASMVSAKILPMTKAPKALLNPTFVENTAMAQQSPRDTMRSVSALMSRRTERRNSGMAKIPTTNHNTRKKTIFITEPSISPPSGLPPPANAESITISTMARMSSSMSTLITVPVNCCCLSPMSSNAL